MYLMLIKPINSIHFTQTAGEHMKPKPLSCTVNITKKKIIIIYAPITSSTTCEMPQNLAIRDVCDNHYRWVNIK